MLRIYYHNRECEVIRQYELENFIMLYEAYKALKGNSFIDKIYKEVLSWEVITEKEKDELMEYARLNADFQNEFDITKLLSKIAELETRVKVLEEKNRILQQNFINLL